VRIRNAHRKQGAPGCAKWFPTWDKINDVLLQYAEDKEVEDGRRVRIDPTVTEFSWGRR
jgi:hypothetical protein